MTQRNRSRKSSKQVGQIQDTAAPRLGERVAGREDVPMLLAPFSLLGREIRGHELSPAKLAVVVVPIMRLNLLNRSLRRIQVRAGRLDESYTQKLWMTPRMKAAYLPG
jgi:hypothetical protein